MKPSTTNEPQYYEGIKVRAQPLIINIQPTSNPVTPQPTTTPSNNNNKGHNRRNKPSAQVVVTAASPQSPSFLTVLADNSNSNDSHNPPVSPASPILKAQLSAPPKQRDANATPTSKGDMKSQVTNQRKYFSILFISFLSLAYIYSFNFLPFLTFTWELLTLKALKVDESFLLLSCHI